MMKKVTDNLPLRRDRMGLHNELCQFPASI